MSSKKERERTTAAEKQVAKDKKAAADNQPADEPTLQEQYSPDPISDEVQELQRSQTHEEK